MADPTSPAEDAWRSLFHRFEEPAARTLRFAAVSGGPKPALRPFRFFALEDQNAAGVLADEFDRLAGRDRATHNQSPPTRAQLEAVMSRFHEVAANNGGLAKAALRRFISRWPNADVLPMPTLRQQLAALKRQQPNAFASFQAAALTAGAPSSGEDAMLYYRHDIDLSDHHLHWHNLYNFQDPEQGMQGRLFLYMHQQMLARYDTERHAVGLPPVEPFLQWNDPTSWHAAFASTDLPKDPLAPWINAVWVKNDPEGYVDFDDQGHSPLEHAGEDKVAIVLAGLKHVRDGIAAKTYSSYDELGADLEASNQYPGKGPGPHNQGHVVLATVAPDDQTKYFVMISTEVAMSTPVFYRWHRAIDDFGWAWQESQGPDPTKYVIPSVGMRRGTAPTATRGADVILTPRSAIPDIQKPGFNLDAWGEAQFGGAKFDAPADPALDLAELVTELRQDPDIPGAPFLSIQTDWIYFLRMRNSGTADATVTVRIWLAAVDLAKDRRRWIEMDKFLATIPAGANKVVSRGSWQSTVVRRKSVGEPMTLAETKDEYNDNDPPTDPNAWCECGLPYRLLLPRGTAEGMPVRFLVLLTDAQQDGTAALAEPQCGSVLYCGRNNQTWPDNQEMGFPFHRPFATASDPVFSHFESMPNAVWRDATIRCVEETTMSLPNEEFLQSAAATRLRDLWEKAVTSDAPGPGQSAAQALAIGVNFRIHLLHAFEAAWETAQVAVKISVAAHAPFDPVAWLEVSAEIVNAVRSVFASLVQRMRPIDYVTCVILSNHLQAMTKDELREAVVKFLAEPNVSDFAWYLGMNVGLIRRAQEVLRTPNWLDGVLEQLDDTDFVAHEGDTLTFKRHDYNIGWRAE